MIRAAQVQIETTPKVGSGTASRTGAKIERVLGPLKTIIALFDGDGPTVCVISSAMGVQASDVSHLIRSTAADALGLPFERVLLFSSHNHCGPSLQRSRHTPYNPSGSGPDPAGATPLGKSLARQIGRACRELREQLQPVTVHWAVGHERRITYNRKGRRADGSTFFMREEDRQLVARDFSGDIDDDATVVCLKDRDGRPAGFFTSFTGHPVTSYHPEHMIAFGEWPQLACDHLSARFGHVPAAFLQGCCGDVNSKRMLCGDVPLSRRFGRYLGGTFVNAARKLTPSDREDFDLCLDTALVPLAKLPSPRTLDAELAEIDDFIARADARDEDTLHCVGLNFPVALTPAYRARLVEAIRPWTEWALRTHHEGRTNDLPTHIPMPMAALRIGDVAIVGMPCEPFLGIGRQIKAASPLPLAVPCGYMNESYGYVPDGPNAGDREYMSSFYRYSRFWPAYRKPAGDALASCAQRMLKRIANSV